MTVTSLQAFQVVLDELNKIWVAVQSSAQAWSATPNQACRVATVPVQTALNQAINSIGQVRKEVDNTATGELLDNIGNKLAIYKTNLLFEKEKQSVTNASLLIQTWKTTLAGLLNSIANQSPEAAETSTFRTLAGYTS